eukprot:SM000133S26778  [mRNA]  locus=s133:9559:12346:- [translate_table: standard]
MRPETREGRRRGRRRRREGPQGAPRPRLGAAAARNKAAGRSPLPQRLSPGLQAGTTWVCRPAWGRAALPCLAGASRSCRLPPIGSSQPPAMGLAHTNGVAALLLAAAHHPSAVCDIGKSLNCSNCASLAERPSPRQKRWWRPIRAFSNRNTCQASPASRGSSGTHEPDATPRVRSPPGQDQLPWLASSFWASLVSTLQGANAYLPQAVLGSTILALAHPPAFTWFTTKYYAPALGILMFAVGVNLSVHDFELVLHRPAAIALGYFGQFVVKPVLGVLASSTLIPLLHLPEAIGSGLVLTACVSGAQLSNYATFLVERSMAPLSIVMTALSTLSAVLVTPALTLALLGKRLPVDFKGMMLNILQIVVVPIAAGLLLNRYGGRVASAVKPFLPVVSVLTTALCVGSPLATNISSLRSATGLLLVVPVIAFHTAAFVVGYWMAVAFFRKNTEQVALARTISLETAWTGMQSSLLALALANRFFSDPLVSLCPAISTVLMSIMGFALVLLWSKPTSMDSDVRA